MIVVKRYKPTNVNPLARLRRLACVQSHKAGDFRVGRELTLSAKGEIWIIEIKSSTEDFRVDRKWPDYRSFCDRLYFATNRETPPEIFPDDAGLFVADAYGAELLRDAPEHRLSPPARKSMTLNFSRIAAARLMHAEWASDRLGLPNPNEPSADESPEF